MQEPQNRPLSYILFDISIIITILQKSLSTLVYVGHIEESRTDLRVPSSDTPHPYFCHVHSSPKKVPFLEYSVLETLGQGQ